MHIAINTDYEYPIYLYTTVELAEKHKATMELHIPLNNTNKWYCAGIPCHDCPVVYECDENTSIVSKFFPALQETNPEWFI